MTPREASDRARRAEEGEPLVEHALAKVNLTLQVIGRRADGYHDLESLVAFARHGDRLTFAPGPALALDIGGPNAGKIGEITDNLVLKAVRALAARIEGLRLGSFRLEKRLPVAAGLGGGSADAARMGSSVTTRACSKRRAPPAPTCRSVSSRARA